MNKLEALIEAAKAAVGYYATIQVEPETILELCALLTQAEEALKTTVAKMDRMWSIKEVECIDETLAAIKQWKVRT